MLPRFPLLLLLMLLLLLLLLVLLPCSNLCLPGPMAINIRGVQLPINVSPAAKYLLTFYAPV